MVHDSTIMFAWDVPAFNYKEKKVDWYWWVGIIVTVIILLSIFLWQNYIFAFFILIAGIMIVFQGVKKPGIISIEMSEQGIKYGDNVIPYDNMDYFWIESGNEYMPARLMLHSNIGMHGYDPIIIPNEISIVELRDFLLDNIEEREMRESLLQKLLHKIGI